MEAEATAASVIKFGEISPIRQYFQSLGQFCKDLFRIWQNFEPTLAIILCFWGKFSFFMAKYGLDYSDEFFACAKFHGGAKNEKNRTAKFW